MRFLILKNKSKNDLGNVHFFVTVSAFSLTFYLEQSPIHTFLNFTEMFWDLFRRSTNSQVSPISYSNSKHCPPRRYFFKVNIKTMNQYYHISRRCFLSLPPENISKPDIFRYYKGGGIGRDHWPKTSLAFKRQPHNMVKHTGNNSSAISNELFECV